jgi:hypothetical protein
MSLVNSNFLNIPKLIRSLNDDKWKNAVTLMIEQTKNEWIVDKKGIWLHIIKKDLFNNNKYYKETYKNNKLIYSESIYR